MNAANPTRLFRWLRGRLLRNSLRVMVQQGQIRVLSIFLCSILVWTTIFVLVLIAMQTVEREAPFAVKGEFIMPALFDLGYAALTVFLVFSTGIILSSSLFSSTESSFLLSTPLPDDHIFRYKFQGAVAFSSWAFVLLGSPVMIAYGIVVEAPWYYYCVMPVFFIGFVVLPGALGALFCLLIVNVAPRKRKQLVIAGTGLFLVAVGLWFYSQFRGARHEFGTREWVSQIFDAFALVQNQFIPSHWLSHGLLSAAWGDWDNLLYYLSLIWSNSLFFFLVTAWVAKRLYRRGFNRVTTGGSIRRRYGGLWMDRVIEKMLFFMDRNTRLLVVKDFRTFRRDPTQWAQILIFAGLGVLYFSYVSRFYKQNIGWTFRNWISLLTLVATSFMMCAYTGRFIFPMLSLEGRKFWILGLLPMQRERLMWGKFAFSALGCVVIAEFLIVFSNVMLEMPPLLIGVHAVTTAVLALGLSGLSVGLGTCMPNFRESDPSKIAVGFGGTLNLVAGLLFLASVIAIMVLPWHLHVSDHGGSVVLQYRHIWLFLLFIMGLLIGVAAVVIPLSMGARALRKMEF